MPVPAAVSASGGAELAVPGGCCSQPALAVTAPSSSPGRSCQSGSSCSRHLPGVVTDGGDARQVLQL
ncbi:unnamed protein product, partial [Bubo scandiacus]